VDSDNWRIICIILGLFAIGGQAENTVGTGKSGFVVGVEEAAIRPRLVYRAAYLVLYGSGMAMAAVGHAPLVRGA
jgi:hypothetical protein